MTETIVPASEPPRPGTWRRYWWVVSLGLLIGVLVLASLVPVPYYAVSPGGAEGVAERVVVTDGPSYPPTGEIYLMTVSLRRATAAEALLGWLDPDTDVFKEEAVKPPDLDPGEFREYNLGLMASAKQTAVAVAFEELGFDVVDGSGAEVTAVPAGTPADGIVRVGDTIVAVAGDPVRDDDDAVRLIGTHQPGDVITLTLEGADGARRDEVVTLGSQPQTPARPLVGVQLRTKGATLDLPYQVDIDSEDIGGPSAGLAFTLQVLDTLTPGELTGGHRVAATGTIELGGNVGLVGGVRQKTLSVKDAGIDLFLVPSGELEEAREVAGDDVRVEPVDTLDDALAVLATVGGNGTTLDRSGVIPA